MAGLKQAHASRSRVHAGLDADTAFEWLDRAYAMHDVHPARTAARR